MIKRHLTVLVIVVLFGCATEHPSEQLPNGQFFTVQVISDQFIIFVTDPQTIRLATENFQGSNHLFPIGHIARGNGGFNQPWDWHLIPETVRMTEAAIEVCDGRPSYVESNLDSYLNAGSYCPWSGKIVKIGR
jgi:hypothetical protein